MELGRVFFVKLKKWEGTALRINNKYISTAVIKYIATFSMLIDHIMSSIYADYMINKGYDENYLFSEDIYYIIGRSIIGRIAMPLFCFLISEGALRSKNRKKYVLRIFLIALVSEYPHYLLFGKEDKTINVIFGLLLGLLCIMTYDYFKDKFNHRVVILASIVLFSLIAVLIRSEYTVLPVILIMSLYLSGYNYERKAFLGAVAFLLGTLIFSLNYVTTSFGAFGYDIVKNIDIFTNAVLRNVDAELAGLLAFLLIYGYNGQKGNLLPRYIYYIFYPAHILLLYLFKI